MDPAVASERAATERASNADRGADTGARADTWADRDGHTDARGRWTHGHPVTWRVSATHCARARRVTRPGVIVGDQTAPAPVTRLGPRSDPTPRASTSSRSAPSRVWPVRSSRRTSRSRFPDPLAAMSSRGGPPMARARSNSSTPATAHGPRWRGPTTSWATGPRSIQSDGSSISCHLAARAGDGASSGFLSKEGSSSAWPTAGRPMSRP